MKKLLAVTCLLFFSMSSFAQWMGRDTEVPAYHTAPPKQGEVLDKLLTPSQVDVPHGKYEHMQRHAFALAAKIPKVIYQEPCYCRCDRSMGHTSLHSCFEGQHAAICAACLKELYYTYLMTKQKKTPDQIREGIVAGEWQSIDLETAGTIE